MIEYAPSPKGKGPRRKPCGWTAALYCLKRPSCCTIAFALAMTSTLVSTDLGSNQEYKLSDLLEAESPRIRVKRPPGRSKTNTKGKLWLTPSKIKRWAEFHRDALETCCEGLFSEMLSYNVEPYQLPRNLKKDSIRVSEDGLEDSIAAHMRNIVASALLEAQSRCDKLSEPYIEWVKGTEALPPPRMLRPDWAGIRRSDSQDLVPQNLLPGETKPSTKWSSSSVELYDRKTREYTPNWLWPIKQIFTYCIGLKVRYGYLITDTELVVCRVHTPKEGQNETNEPDDGWIEYESIKYNEDIVGQKDKELGVHMALWWLHILAGNSGPICSEYGPLADEVFQPQKEVCLISRSSNQSRGGSIEGSQDETLDLHPEHSGTSFVFSFDGSNPDFSFHSLDTSLSFMSSKTSEGSTVRSRPKRKRRMETAGRLASERKKKKKK